MNANGVLKVYFTHDRKVYMHTAKRKDAIATTAVYKGDCKHKSSLFSSALSLEFVCRQRRHSIYTVIQLVLMPKYSRSQLITSFLPFRSKEMLYTWGRATADTFLPLIHPLILTVNMGAKEGHEVLQTAYQCGFACAPSTHWGQCKLSHRYRTWASRWAAGYRRPRRRPWLRGSAVSRSPWPQRHRSRASLPRTPPPPRHSCHRPAHSPHHCEPQL